MEWDQTYGGVDAEFAKSIIQTSDGGYAMLGDTYSFGAGDSDFWLVKTDGSGNIEWSQTYGGTGSDYGYSVIQTNDGGYALAGYSNSFSGNILDSDFWLIKTDAAGNIEWSHTYGGTGWDVAFSAVQTVDGGYALAGNGFAHLVKTDANGNFLWSNTYGEAASHDVRSVVQTDDGGYALGGYTMPVLYADFWLVKTDSDGNLQWEQTYDRAGANDAGYSVVQTSDGGYAIAGTTGDPPFFDIWLVKTDATGNLQWDQTYGGAGDDGTFSVIQTIDDGYAVGGWTSTYGAGNGDFWLIKTDATGNIQWSQTYGGTGWDSAWSVVQTNDGGYALAGTTESFGAGSIDFYLVKVRYERDVAVTGITLSKTVVGQGFTVQIYADVENQGSHTETFDVTLYANLLIIQTQTITLDSGASTTLTFTWNTASYGINAYAISAYAWPVPDETLLEDNTLVGGTVAVTIPGDVTGDFLVNIMDAAQLGLNWLHLVPPAPANVDINGDGIINVADATQIGLHWQQHP